MSDQSTIYMICPDCLGTGQVINDKAITLQFVSLPCPRCRQVRVVPVPINGSSEPPAKAEDAA